MRVVVRADRRELAAVFAGGFGGTVARAGLVEALPADGGGWPWATFIANVLGAFMLGYFVTRLQERLPLSAYRRPLLGTGLCGALTTFSTMRGRAPPHPRRGTARSRGGVRRGQRHGRVSAPKIRISERAGRR